MSEIPVDMLTRDEFFQWYKSTEELAKAKLREATLRARVFRHMVPVPVEGMNTIELDTHPLMAGIPPTGYVFKAQHVISRNIDEGALTTLSPKFKEALIVVDKLVKRKPELAVGEYRKLTEEQRKLFDQALIVKPGSPQLEIVLPKKRGDT